LAVKVGHADADAVFHFTCAKIMQQRPPLLVFFQVFCHMFGEKDVTGVTAIHHPLRDVKSGPGKIRTIIHINHTADRPAVNAHPQLQAWMFLARAANLNRALCRCSEAGVKDQCHAIAGCDLQQAARGFGALKLF